MYYQPKQYTSIYKDGTTYQAEPIGIGNRSVHLAENVDKWDKVFVNYENKRRQLRMKECDDESYSESKCSSKKYSISSNFFIFLK